MGEARTVVRIDGVSKVARDGDRTITLLAPTTIDLPAGSLVAVAGPSGSGKTTLCNIVIGWETPDTGTVVVEPGASAASAWAEVAVAPQRLALLPTLSLRENVVLPMWASGRTVDGGELAELCAELQIDTLLDRLPHEVSFGEQQRVAIARALLGRPMLAVLDEPTGHQDDAHAAAVVATLLAARDRGTCVLVATHDADLVAAADLVVRLRVGGLGSNSPG